MRVATGKVQAREGNEAVVSLDDGSTRRLCVPDGLDVGRGLSVRIIEGSDPNEAPFVRWGDEERAAERQGRNGYVRAR